MKILMIGCEYSGTTTLAIEITKWITKVVGGNILGAISFHDHMKLVEGGHVNPEGLKERDEKETQEHINFSPHHRQGYHHYMLAYHTAPGFFNDPHHLMTGMHIDDEIYGPRYKGYPEDQVKTLRLLSRHFEKDILEAGPDTVLVLVKASPDVIRKRIKECPQEYQIIKDEDIETLLSEFEYHFKRSRVGSLGKKIILDTSKSSVSETLKEFVEKIEPHITDEDRLRILTRGKMLAS